MPSTESIMLPLASNRCCRGAAFSHIVHFAVFAPNIPMLVVRLLEQGRRGPVSPYMCVGVCFAVAAPTVS